MRLMDLFEAASDVIYHYTGLHSAAKILLNGAFELSSSIGSVEEQYAPPGYPYFLSTTRTLTGGYHNIIGSQAVMFNLDGRWINSRYKAGPVDYWGDRAAGSNYAGRPSEAEDRIYSKNPSMPIGGITSIHVYVEPMDEKSRANWGESYPALARKILIAAKKRGIPAYLYEDAKAWRRQDTKQAVPINRERTTLKGKEPTGYRGGRTTSWLDPWLELIHKNKTQDLSKRAKDYAYDLRYSSYGINDMIRSLSNDFANARKPTAGLDRTAAVSIISWMTANKINTLKDLVDAMQKKWTAIKDRESSSTVNEENSTLNEIGYADTLGELSIPPESIIKNSRDVGVIDGQHVFAYEQASTTLYFFKSPNDTFDALVLLDGNHIRAVKNYSKQPGAITALIGFIVHRLNMPLEIASTEQLTSDGFRWLKMLLQRNGKGFTIVDNHGRFPDVGKLEQEWIASRKSDQPGTTSIRISENATTKKLLEEKSKLIITTTVWLGTPNLL